MISVLLSKKVEVDENLSFLVKEENQNSDLRFPSQQKYERDLKVLVPFLPFYEQVVREVELSSTVLKKETEQKSKV